jgi:hypothetical protein
MVQMMMPAPMMRFDGWREHAPTGSMLWVDVAAQRLWVLEEFVAVDVVRCSTAAAGLGENEGSFRTPRGWHGVSARIGDRLPPGAVLQSRVWTGDRWSPAEGLIDGAGRANVSVGEDLVLTRVLWLEGREPGRNRGGDVDTRARYIYIHGTNQPEALGTPASHGCIRVSCADVIRLHDRVGVDHAVWIG